MVRAMRSMRLDDAVDDEFVAVPVVLVVVDVVVVMGSNDEDDDEVKLLLLLLVSSWASPSLTILECFSPDEDAFTKEEFDES